MTVGIVFPKIWSKNKKKTSKWWWERTLRAENAWDLKPCLSCLYTLVWQPKPKPFQYANAQNPLPIKWCSPKSSPRPRAKGRHGRPRWDSVQVLAWRHHKQMFTRVVDFPQHCHVFTRASAQTHRYFCSCGLECFSILPKGPPKVPRVLLIFSLAVSQHSAMTWERQTPKTSQFAANMLPHARRPSETAETDARACWRKATSRTPRNLPPELSQCGVSREGQNSKGALSTELGAESWVHLPHDDERKHTTGMASIKEKEFLPAVAGWDIPKAFPFVTSTRSSAATVPSESRGRPRPTREGEVVGEATPRAENLPPIRIPRSTPSRDIGNTTGRSAASFLAFTLRISNRRW